MNQMNRVLAVLLSLTILGCSESGSSKKQLLTIDIDSADSGSNGVIELSDINDSKNLISESVFTKGETVGVTASLSGVSTNVTYKLNDDAEGRFQIDSSTGVVSVADPLKINSFQNSHYSIVVKAEALSGEVEVVNFDIEVAQDYNNVYSLQTRSSFLDWDTGKENNIKGWDWHSDVAYGNPGWILSENGTEMLGGRNHYTWGNGPRIFNKGDYGKANLAKVVTDDIAPSTSAGGALKVYDPNFTEDNRSTWWLWYDGIPLSGRKVTNDDTDRMDFYLKIQGVQPIDDSGHKESIRGDNFHVGTYLCWEGESPAFGTGEGCPYEGPGNQHYYHYLTLNSGAWIHVQLDQHPQHKRNVGNAGNNPTLATDGKNYFAQINKMYFEIRYPQEEQTSYIIDEIGFYSNKFEIEPNQNEESITSLWVGYWQDSELWEIGFHDESFDVLLDGSYSTFEIRWSTKPITNATYQNANVVEPMLYSGAKYTGSDENHYLRRANDRATNVWTRFTLPKVVTDNYSKIYFAVKDVSVEGGNVGTQWPWTRPDGHDAPTQNIKTIDYFIRK